MTAPLSCTWKIEIQKVVQFFVRRTDLNYDMILKNLFLIAFNLKHSEFEEGHGPSMTQKDQKATTLMIKPNH